MNVEAMLGFIGLGHMGLPMASRLLAAGHKVLAFDLRQDACLALAAQGAEIAASPRAVADRAITVFLSLPTPQIVRQVIEGTQQGEGLLGASAMKVVVDLSTTGASTTIELARVAQQAGVCYVDSPVSGGVSGAVAGTLALMCACPRKDYQAIEGLLAVFGKAFHVGEAAGLGQSMKLANNMLSATAMAASAEAIAFGVKQGLNPMVMAEVIQVSSGANTAIRDKFPKAIIPRLFNLGFTSGLMNKDVQLCLEEAQACGVPMAIGSAVGAIWNETVERLGAESDFSEVAKIIEAKAGVLIEVKPSSSKE
ncbi:MAG: NAD(P)-dependent oxidoreductase [Betaproteobacteria bacterium]|nr:NAD(P)-dependent oxidoreductase [Pseudomonadota bacterium]NBO11492.1 NAD(P)-dependent oxidoreductase [Betaproteobacteria bacterium]NBO43952.1 NAD(P)-dependent oxidoreductase [Betaproteobacteria bacterium]NBP10766.1 NAD(P)-dependent oxidoreductase [Betaproteobacteria bacterium]NBQ08831.1 NAD(P)-dependent oxidoreductase [Betaproteobacteria bacterium]